MTEPVLPAESVAAESWADIVAADPDTKTPEYQAAYAEAAHQHDLRILIGWASLIAGKPKNVNAAIDRLTDALIDGAGADD